jgi:hypothetical protein
MDNQHQKISGYRDFGQETIDKINEIKGLGNGQLKPLIDRLIADHGAELHQTIGMQTSMTEEEYLAKMAELADASKNMGTAQEHLRIGFMMLIRVVARPKTEY